MNPPAEVSEEKKEELKKEAFHLIDSYHACIDPEEVITVFPDTTSFPDLFHYTLQAITELTEQMYNTRMKYNLTMSDYMEVRLLVYIEFYRVNIMLLRHVRMVWK